MDLYQVVSDYVAKLKAKLTEARADGKLSAGEVLALFYEAIRLLVEQASAIGGLTGEQKKELVTQAALRFYDDIVAPLDIPYVPNAIESFVVDPALRKLIPDLIEAAYQAFKAFRN